MKRQGGGIVLFLTLIVIIGLTAVAFIKFYSNQENKLVEEHTFENPYLQTKDVPQEISQILKGLPPLNPAELQSPSNYKTYENGKDWSVLYPEGWEVSIVPISTEYYEYGNFNRTYHSLIFSQGNSKLIFEEIKTLGGNPVHVDAEEFNKAAQDFCKFVKSEEIHWNEDGVTYITLLCKKGIIEYMAYHKDEPVDTATIDKEKFEIITIRDFKISDSGHYLHKKYEALDFHIKQALVDVLRDTNDNLMGIATNYAYIESDDEDFIKEAVRIYIEMYNN